MKKQILWIVIAGVACAVIFFFVGMTYGKNTAQPSFARGNFSSSTASRFLGRGGGSGGAGGGIVAGEIISENGQSLTLQLPNGNSEVVFYSSSTSVTKPTETSISALSTGTAVMVVGTTNSDGSLTAQSIQARGGGGSSGTNSQ